VQHQNYKAGFEVVKPDPKMGQCQKKLIPCSLGKFGQIFTRGEKKLGPLRLKGKNEEEPQIAGTYIPTC
jgi:hypothetical protein